MNITVTTFGSAEYLNKIGLNPEGELTYIDVTPRRITVADIKRAVCDHFNLALEEMTSARRAREYARPRQVAMYLAHQMTRMSLPEIGRRFGNRDHTTVIHGCRQIERLIAEGDTVKDDVTGITDTLKSPRQST